MQAFVFQNKASHAIVSTSALARHLGLSRWTISRVLNGHPEVKLETSRRVRQAMEELGFVPNPLGRALRGSRTGMIGVCFQGIQLPIVARKIATLQHVLRQVGFRALLEVTDGDPDIEMIVIRHFVAMHVDGLVLVGGMSPGNSERIRALLSQHKISVVLVDPLEHSDLPTVELNRASGIRLVFQHLHQLGHRHFTLLGIDERVPYGRVRLEALRLVASEYGLPWDRHFIPIADPEPPDLDYSYGRRLTERFLTLSPRPTAILALNDQVAIGAMARLLEAGLSVPGDVSVVGFDNLSVSAHVSPSLTSIDQHVEEIMGTAVAILERQIRGKRAKVPLPHRVTPLLVSRTSTGQAPPASVGIAADASSSTFRT